MSLSRPAGLVALVFLVFLGACGDGGDAASEAYYEVGSLRVSRVVAPVPVTGERTALYLRIENRGSEPDALVEVAASPAGRATLHRSRASEGRMTMAPTSEVPVPADGVVTLRPGGYHVMLEELAGPLESGTSFGARLRFRRAGLLDVEASVVPYAELEALFPPDEAASGRGG